MVQPIDLLITDHRMPGMDGVDLVRKARAQGYKNKVLIHALRLLDEEKSAYESLGVDGILWKSGNLNAFFKAIRGLGFNVRSDFMAW